MQSGSLTRVSRKTGHVDLRNLNLYILRNLIYIARSGAHAPHPFSGSAPGFRGTLLRAATH